MEWALSDIAVLEAQLAEVQRLLTAAEKDKAALAGGKTIDEFQATVLKLEEENHRLRQRLVRAEMANVRLAIEQEAELKEEREKTQRIILPYLEIILKARQKATNKSWWRRLRW